MPSVELDRSERSHRLPDLRRASDERSLADENLVVWLDVSSSGDAAAERSGESIDENGKEPVLVEYTVCLLLLFGYVSAIGLVHLPTFERRSFAVAVVSTELS